MNVVSRKLKRSHFNFDLPLSAGIIVIVEDKPRGTTKGSPL
jgi:hypothetical protein